MKKSFTTQFFALLLMMLAGVNAAWADDVSYQPVLDVNFRTNAGNTGWQTVKNAANDASNRPTLVATIEAPAALAVTNKTTGQSYQNLNEAFAALTDVDTELEVSEDQKITARLNWDKAHTLTITPTADITLKGGPGMMWFLVKNSNAVLKIGSAAHKITFDGEGKAMTIKTQGVVQRESNGSFELQNVEFKDFDLNNTAYLCGAKNAGGTITLQNITVTNCTSPAGGYIYDLRVANDALILKGHLNIDANSTGTAILKQANPKGTGTEGRIKVDDPDFTASKVLTIDWTNLDGKDVFVEGSPVVVGVKSDAIASCFQLTNGDWTLARKNNDLVLAKAAQATAKIGETGYADLAAALTAAVDGDVITLLDDQEVSTRVNIQNKAITIDGQGKTIKRASTYTNGLVFLTAKPGEGEQPASLTLQNLTLDGQNIETSAAFIEASNSGTTTLNNVTIKNVTTTANAVIVNKAGGKLVLQGEIGVPSIFVGKGLVVDAAEASISQPITLVTDNGATYGMAIEGGKTADFTCETFRLSQQTDGIYLMPKAVAASYSHPALLHTSSDIEAVKTRLEDNEELATAAYARLETQSGGQAAGAVEVLKRMDAANWSSTYPDYSNFSRAATDARLAYSLALRYQLKNSTASATAAVKILNDWAKTNKGVLRLKNYANNIPDPNEYLMTIQAYQFANAAELLRGYEGWTAADQQKFQNWIRQTFADVAIQFLENHHKNDNPLHYWLNWDLAALNALLSVGILCDDQSLVDYALNYTTQGTGTGNVQNAVVATHQDADSEETLAQCQESGRDQGHSTLDITLLGVLCQTAQNIGTDLFTPYKALEMAEYVGKYNLKNAEGGFVYDNVPFSTYNNGEVEHTAISADARGTERPCWELFHAYAKANGKSDIYTEAWVKYMRQQNAWGEGEGSSTDELGFGTLMFGAEVVATGIENAITDAQGSTLNAQPFNLSGQRVQNGYRGLVIKNGRKHIAK